MRASFASLLLLLSLGGCASSQTVPGKAGLRIQVLAQPKQGADMSRHRLLIYDTPTPKHDHGAFEKVNYANLDDIVVWLEPASSPAPRPPATIDLGAKPGRISVASVGQQLIFHNASHRTIKVYSVSDGNDFDLGSLKPDGRSTYEVKSPGLIEVLADGMEDPLASIYAAPTPWVWLTRSLATLRANNLPPGECIVKSWHPRLPGGETRTLLKANRTASVSVIVSVNGLPKVGQP